LLLVPHRSKKITATKPKRKAEAAEEEDTEDAPDTPVVVFVVLGRIVGQVRFFDVVAVALAPALMSPTPFGGVGTEEGRTEEPPPDPDDHPPGE